MSNATLLTLSCPWLIVLFGCGLCPLVVGFVFWLWALLYLIMGLLFYFWVIILVTYLNLQFKHVTFKIT